MLSCLTDADLSGAFADDHAMARVVVRLYLLRKRSPERSNQARLRERLQESAAG
jgi:hypothetical protein